ncbi:MAG TPA: hypothetical protein VMD47_07635 [Candidatus Acidoferrales bacterium]|nr:hypothetical protein [Candidatus Acidoferrales bacterium]
MNKHANPQARRIWMIVAVALALFFPCLTGASLAQSSSNTTHLSETAFGKGPDKQTAHDNAYAMADSTLRIACGAAALAAGGTFEVQNEQEDSTSYGDYSRAGFWTANIAIEGDCVITTGGS